MIEDRKLVALPRKPAVSQVIPLLRVEGLGFSTRQTHRDHHVSV